jgi:hypothetical protein
MAIKSPQLEPSLTGIAKSNLDRILHYLFLQKIHHDKNPYLPLPFYQNRHPYFLFQYHKNFQLINRLKGRALSMLKKQYAKKPRNPE